MNYYLNNYPKTEFYYIGKQTPTEFTEGRGLKFIKEYLGEEALEELITKTPPLTNHAY